MYFMLVKLSITFLLTLQVLFNILSDVRGHFDVIKRKMRNKFDY